MNWRKHRNLATAITVGNYKGGVGKTTNVVLISYTLAKMGIKVLVIDLDPQSNATKSLMLTKFQNTSENEVAPVDKTLMWGIQEGNLETLPVGIISNLFLIPSYIDFENFSKFVYSRYPNNEQSQDYFLKTLIDPLKPNYDIILIDVPPMSIEITRNAVISSDFVLISLQTQERSLTGAENYVNQLNKLQQQYDLDLDVVGVLPVLLKNKGAVDQYIIENATKIFGTENMFSTIIPQMERIKRFDVNGITDEDQHDKKVLNIYQNVTNELLERLALFNE